MGASRRSELHGWLAVAALAVGTFAEVTAEQLPVGLLTPIARAMDVPEGTAGLMVTAPGLVAFAAAPLLPVAVRRLDRRFVLAALITLMAATNAATAASDSYPVMLAARLLLGIAVGGFWALAAGIAVRLVPARHMGRAMAVAFGGGTAANVLGVPVGTSLGQATDWRIPFLAVGALGLAVAAAVLRLLPPLPAERAVRLRTLRAQLGNRVVRAGTIATFLLVGGHYAAFTYAAPILQRISGFRAGAVGPMLLGYGAAGIAGTFLAGAALGRSVRGTVLAAATALGAVLALFPVLGTTPVGGGALLVLWGLALGVVPVAVQTWILRAAPDAPEAATALNTSVFNLAIALGALFGGVVVDAVSLPGTLWLGGGLALLTAAAVGRVAVPAPAAAPGQA